MELQGREDQKERPDQRTLTLPYPTLPYLTLLYLTLPYLTLPYPTLPYPDRTETPNPKSPLPCPKYALNPENSPFSSQF